MEDNNNLSNLSFLQGNVSNEELDPRILATFYTMYRIGKYGVDCIILGPKCTKDNFTIYLCCDMDQSDTIGKIEVFPSIILSTRVTNWKNDIHKFSSSLSDQDSTEIQIHT